MTSKKKFREIWFKDSTENTDAPYINERAARARAGFLLTIPIIMLAVRLEHGHHDETIVDAVNGAIQTIDYDHTIPVLLAFFVMYEMLTAMFIKTAHLSITTQLGVLTTKNQTSTYQAMRPKKFAWGIGVIISVICQASLLFIIFQAPTPFVQALNGYILAICLLFMWLETICNICAGCVLHKFLVQAGVIKESCEMCVYSEEPSIPK